MPAARKQQKFDPQEVRSVAAGRWRDVLVHVAGLPLDALNGEHHPCPKCGGEDRFRLIDEAAGAVLCNQCFATKNGDGFAAVGWALGVKFGEALRLVADYLGLAPRGDVDPAKDLQWMEWSRSLAAFFCLAKSGVTEQALLDAGARFARYKGQFTVLAFPIVGQDLDAAQPVGWAIANYSGGPLPKWDKQGNVTGQTKYKITYGSRPGLVGRRGVERLKVAGLAELVWKVEGISDLLAMQAAIPEPLRERHLVVTNANGAGETPRWPATMLAAQPCCVLHDADEPGQDGAKAWTEQIAAQAPAGIVTRLVTLPYDVQPTHGKDLRDYLAEGRTYADLLALADAAAPTAVVKTESGEVDYRQHTNPALERVLKKLQLEVLYEDESGAIRLFSAVTKKSSTVRQIARLKHEDLILIAGAPAMVHVVSSERDSEPAADTWTMTDVRRAIALAAALRRGKSDERGIGVWQGLDQHGNETATVVLVNNTEGARFNGDGVLRRIPSPRADGLVLDFGAASGKDWFAFAELEQYLGDATSVAWRQRVLTEATDLFARWRWRCDAAPTLVAGLVLATWVQTIWEWRPLIGVTGESNSGKSFLFAALGGEQNRRGIFGQLAYKPDQSTEAGIRQHMANTACAVLLDELESSPERTKILKTLRTSTRGGYISKGAPGGQKGVDFIVRHIVWTAATEAGLHEQPDLNRWIQLDLLRARPEDAGKLTLPEPAELQSLGQRMLAIAVRTVMAAKRLAAALKPTKAPGIAPRTIEVYSAPAAILAASEGYGEDVARGLLLELLANVDLVEQGQTDQDELLADILTASVLLDARAGVKTIGQVLASPALSAEHSGRLSAEGVRLMDDGSLFVAPQLVQKNLLKGTRWSGLRIDQIALRLEGAIRRPIRIGGAVRRGVVIPRRLLDLGGDGEQLQAFV